MGDPRRTAGRSSPARLRKALTFALMFHARGLQSQQRLHRFNIVNHFVCAENLRHAVYTADRKEDEIIRAALLCGYYLHERSPRWPRINKSDHRENHQ